MISSSCDEEERKGRIDPSVKKTHHNGIFELLGNFDNGGDNFHYIPEEHLLVGKGANSNGILNSNIMHPNQQSEVRKN